MEEMLIEKVRSRVFLYDPKSPDYRDHEKRTNAWEEIGAELKMKPKNAKETWEKLRRCFTNALNRRRNKNNGEGTKKMHPWKYEKEMSFLLPSIDTRNTQNNLLIKEIQKESLVKFFDEIGTRKSDNNNLVDTRNMLKDEILSNKNSQDERNENEFYNIQSETDMNSPSDSSKKRKRQTGDTSIIQTIKIKKEKQNRHDDKTFLSRDLDETDMFFLSLAKTTKRLPSIEQAKVKLIVSQTVLQAQIAIGEQEFRSSSVSPVSYISTHSEASN
ncbi:uncharacterized protein LOC130440569 [Diorhabda sublineata]|uniref:uncharacterized protein LOC130440569 n=1 Tax=Diorhabda sublineata TaxID=1163346 RepID=UPI0024E082E9|nr:uncharacterized protein LOC130440569 [Diorhabda sublineata]